MQSATCEFLSRSKLDSKSEKSSRPRLKRKPLLAMLPIGGKEIPIDLNSYIPPWIKKWLLI